MGVRVTPEEEMEGLDLGEHGNEAYSFVPAQHEVMRAEVI
jgi:ammonia channel protein AmtB